MVRNPIKNLTSWNTERILPQKINSLSNVKKFFNFIDNGFNLKLIIHLIEFMVRKGN